MNILDQKVHDYGSFKLINCPSLSSLSNPAEVQSLNEMPGYEVIRVLKSTSRTGIILLQASNQDWEYDGYVTDRMGFTGLLSETGRRESVLRDLDEKRPGWTLVDVVEVASSYLAFLLKRPVQEQGSRQAEDDA